MKPLFLADSFGKSFGRRTVLKSGSVWARGGRVTVLFGRNGSGKSTLLRMATGLLSADHGVVHFAGRSHVRPRLHRLAGDGLFYLPDRRLLSPWRPVRRQLAAVAWRHGRAAVEDAVARLGAGELLDALPRSLSAGERRRVDLCVAVACRPRCLLADEPFAQIAPKDVEIVASALRRLAARGAGIVVTGHESASLLELADEVVWMTAGTTHGLGSAADAAAHEQFRREYLGPRAASPRR